MTDIVERLYKEAEDPKERIFLPRDCFLFGEAAAEIERLRTELETERMRIVACGVAALGNTEASAAQRIGRDNPYWSASYGDVCDAVDREMALRAEVEALRKNDGRYRWLREHHLQIGPDAWIRTGDDLDEAIDAAMEKDKPC